jgi:hypothetical protein
LGNASDKAPRAAGNSSSKSGGLIAAGQGAALISKRNFMGGLSALLAIAGTVSAQPDPILSCSRRASALINVGASAIRAHRRGGLNNGDDIILWEATLSNGQAVSGFCEVSPSNGRVVRLGTDRDSADVKRVYRLTPDDAERLCGREARARFNPGDGSIDAAFLPNTSSKSTYRVEWRYSSMRGTIRKGRCEIDSSTGYIRKFNANSGW